MSRDLGDCLPVLLELNIGQLGIDFLFCPEANLLLLVILETFSCIFFSDLTDGTLE